MSIAVPMYCSKCNAPLGEYALGQSGEFTRYCPGCFPKTLKTVEQHNREIRAERELREQKLRATGVACPHCGHEMEWEELHSVSYMMTITGARSTMRRARCSCGMQKDLETL